MQADQSTTCIFILYVWPIQGSYYKFQNYQLVPSPKIIYLIHSSSIKNKINKKLLVFANLLVRQFRFYELETPFYYYYHTKGILDAKRIFILSDQGVKTPKDKHLPPNNAFFKKEATY